jgi:hypothetical protein
MKGGIKINMKVKRTLTMAMATVVVLCLLLVFVYLYKVSNNKSEQNKGEAYSAYLGQRVEDDFTSIEEVKSANAIVSYDESQNQYSIELSLITDEDINEEQIELYESILRKTFVEVKLTINGVLKANEIPEATTTDICPAIMVNGVVYFDTGHKSTATERCGIMDGQITSECSSSETPSINDQSNFGTGYGYQYGGREGTIEVLLNDGKWYVFATEDVKANSNWQNEPQTEQGTEQVYTLPQAEKMSVELIEWGGDHFKAIVVDAEDNSIFPVNAELSVVFDYETEILLDDGTLMVFNPDEPDTEIIGWEVGTVVYVEFLNYEEYHEGNHFYNQLFASHVEVDNK